MEAIRDYLGDGVYSEYDGFGIWLKANNPVVPTDRIYLEPAVLKALSAFVARVSGDVLLPSAAVALGRKGGSARSEAKAAASRENGKKGGRPRTSA